MRLEINELLLLSLLLVGLMLSVSLSPSLSKRVCNLYLFILADFQNADVRMPIDDATDEEAPKDEVVAVQEEELSPPDLAESFDDSAILSSSATEHARSLLYGDGGDMIVDAPLESPASHVAFSHNPGTGNEADESSTSDFASPYLEQEPPLDNATYDLSEWEHTQNQFDLNQ